MVTKLDELLANTSATDQIEFQIISKGDDHEALNVVIDSVNSAVLDEFREALKHPNNYYDLSHDQWQMSVDVPAQLNKDQIENGLNTDDLFLYLGAQAWVDNYTQEERFFLFNRRNLRSELRIDQENNIQQIVFMFYRSEESEHQEEQEIEEPVKQQSENNKEESGLGFMKSKTKTIRKTAKDMRVPSKYDNQRQPPQEVPLDVIRSLFLAIDQDMDDRISATEILKYIHKTKLTIEDAVAYGLFDE